MAARYGHAAAHGRPRIQAKVRVAVSNVYLRHEKLIWSATNDCTGISLLDRTFFRTSRSGWLGLILVRRNLLPATHRSYSAATISQCIK
jgi:hypothetical protein